MYACTEYMLFYYMLLLCVCKPTEDLTKAKEGPPEFHVQMHDITTNVGEPATFDCKVSGFPRPEVFWTKASLQLLTDGFSVLWRATHKYDMCVTLSFRNTKVLHQSFTLNFKSNC